MRKRISVLVAIGFAFLLGLGVLTSLAMIAGLRETMSRADASQASALEVRASVRSLRADYLASGDAVSRLMLEPGLVDAWTAKRQADDSAAEHLAAAAHATRRGDLRALLEKLDAHDREVTNRIEDELLGLVETDAVAAKRIYFEEYLRAPRVRRDRAHREPRRTARRSWDQRARGGGDAQRAHHVPRPERDPHPDVGLGGAAPRTRWRGGRERMGRARHARSASHAGRDGGGAGHGARGEPHQVRVPGQHESRDPDAAECDHRVHRPRP